MPPFFKLAPISLPRHPPRSAWHLTTTQAVSCFPTSVQELISEAEGNGAPAPLVERLKNLPTDVEFSDPSEVAEALERQDESYEEQARSRRGSV